MPDGREVTAPLLQDDPQMYRSSGLVAVEAGRVASVEVVVVVPGEVEERDTVSAVIKGLCRPDIAHELE